MSVRSFWPPAEAAQVDYERLRAHLLEHGTAAAMGWPLPGSPAAGMAGLIAWPAAEPVFVAELHRRRPPARGARTPTRGMTRWRPATSSCSTPPRLAPVGSVRAEVLP